MTVNRPLLKSLILLGAVALVWIFISRYQKTSIGEQNNLLKPTETPIQTKTSDVHSSDGKMKLIMQTVANKDQSSTYTFSVADISGGNQYTIYTKTVGPKGVMLLPPNSFSPDNKYVYLEESEGNLLNALVFKASSEPFVNGKNYLDVAAHLAQSKPGYQLTHVTGWASPQLLQMDTLTEKLTKGPSFWFDVASRAFLLH